MHEFFGVCPPEFIVKKLKDSLERAEVVHRPVLGSEKIMTARESLMESLSVKLSDPGDWIKCLERLIFSKKHDDNIRNMFEHILEQSVTRKPVDFILSKKEHNKLPPIFGRYFSAFENVFKLEYHTSKRVRDVIYKTVAELRNNPLTRHFYIPIWLPEDNSNLGTMVPSLLGFGVQKSAGCINMMVNLRSSDVEFILYDLWYFMKLLIWIMDETNTNTQAKLTMVMFNLHKYI